MSFYEEQKIEELKITFNCKCNQELIYHSWDENMGDNPYVDVTCNCGIYYKTRGSIRKNGGKEIKIEGTGKFL